MSFTDTLAEMLVILFAIACGYAGNRMGFLGGATDRNLCRLILTIAMPAMTVAAVINGDELPENSVILGVLGVSVLFYGLEALLALVIPCFLGGTPGQKGVWRYALAFPNVGFIGYPVVTALFGEEALFYAVILVLPFNLISFTLGPLMLAGAKRFSLRQVLSPCVVASLIAVVLALAHIRPPALLGEMLGFVGDMSVPLSLLFVGSLLAGLHLGRVLASLRLWVVAALRLLVLPALLLPLLYGLRVDALIRNIAVVQMAMPVAVNGSLLCMEYGGDAESMAQITFVSTLASIVTIPLMAALLL